MAEEVLDDPAVFLEGSLKGFQVAFGCRGIPPFVSDEEV